MAAAFLLRLRGPLAQRVGSAALSAAPRPVARPLRMPAFGFRALTTTAPVASAAAAAATSSATAQAVTSGNKLVGYWLFGCAGLAFGTVVAGGVTRLTGSDQGHVLASRASGSDPTDVFFFTNRRVGPVHRRMAPRQGRQDADNRRRVAGAV